MLYYEACYTPGSGADRCRTAAEVRDFLRNLDNSSIEWFMCILNTEVRRHRGENVLTQCVEFEWKLTGGRIDGKGGIYQAKPWYESTSVVALSYQKMDRQISILVKTRLKVDAEVEKNEGEVEACLCYILSTTIQNYVFILQFIAAFRRKSS